MCASGWAPQGSKNSKKLLEMETPGCQGREGIALQTRPHSPLQTPSLT